MLEHILKDDPVYRQLKDEVEDYCGPVLVSGCTDTAKWHLTSLIGNHRKKQFKIIIVPDENKARQWVEASHFFGEKVQYIPAKDPLFYTADVHGNAIARDRMLAIKQILDDKCGTFVMTIDAVMDQVVPLSDIKNHKMTFKMDRHWKKQRSQKNLLPEATKKHHLLRLQASLLFVEVSLIFSHTHRKAHIVSNYGEMKLIRSEVLIKKVKDRSRRSRH